MQCLRLARGNGCQKCFLRQKCTHIYKESKTTNSVHSNEMIKSHLGGPHLTPNQVVCKLSFLSQRNVAMTSAYFRYSFTNCSQYLAQYKNIHKRFYSTSSRNKHLPIIYLFTKEDCSLCDQAKEVLKPYRHRFTLEEVDITLPENEDWFEMYKYDIPVFHMHEDFLFMHRVDTGILEKALNQYEETYEKHKGKSD